MFDVWSKNFLNFFVVFLVLSLVIGTIGALLSYAVFGTFEPGSGIVPGSPPAGAPNVDVVTLLLYAIAAVVIGAIISSIVVGGMTEYAVRRHRGESMTLQQALRRGLDKFLSILGANILLTLIIFGLVLTPLLLILPAAAAEASGNPSGGARLDLRSVNRPDRRRIRGDLRVHRVQPLPARNHDGERERHRRPIPELGDHEGLSLVAVRSDPHRNHLGRDHQRGDLVPGVRDRPTRREHRGRCDRQWNRRGVARDCRRGGLRPDRSSADVALRCTASLYTRAWLRPDAGIRPRSPDAAPSASARGPMRS